MNVLRHVYDYNHSTAKVAPIFHMREDTFSKASQFSCAVFVDDTMNVQALQAL